jgi:3-deoxy-D-manno-octulosonate 8-phosphate phosphatase (KDO 8-P phosphatase)
MRRVGFSVAVADASPHVLPYAHYITRKNGGHGAAREICELILQVQSLWEGVVRRYFEGPLGP